MIICSPFSGAVKFATDAELLSETEVHVESSTFISFPQEVRQQAAAAVQRRTDNIFFIKEYTP